MDLNRVFKFLGFFLLGMACIDVFKDILLHNVAGVIVDSIWFFVLLYLNRD